MKPGYKSSELWTTLALALVASVAGYLGLNAADTGTLQEALRIIVAVLVGGGGPVALAWKYTHSRTQLKSDQPPWMPQP